MPRNITITFDDGTTHSYNGAPDDVTPDAVEARAMKEFGKKVTKIDGGKAAPAQAPSTSAGQIPADSGPKAPAAVPEKSMSQKVLSFVRPTVEALGAAGGGVLGTALGPLGTVGGAGLGYGLAKGGLDTIEQAMGTRAKFQGPADAMFSGAGDVVTGAAMEAGGRVAGQALGTVIGKARDLGNWTQTKAAKVAQEAAGGQKQQILNALSDNAGQNLTAGQAAAGVNAPTFQALVQNSLKRDPAALNQIMGAQADESLNALTRVAGGANAAEVRGSLTVARESLNKTTGPMREAALRAADTALKNGLPPLKADAIVPEIGKILGKPEYAGNDIMANAVKAIGDDLATWASKNTGIIPGDALDAIRKNSVNAVVAKLRPGMDASSQKSVASGVLSEIKPLIDDAIVNAGGTGYKEYLATHSAGMQKIAEQKLTGEALRMWKTNKDEFVRLVNNESPDVVEKILGPKNYDIAKNLAADKLQVLQDQASKALRDMKVTEQAGQGQEALKQVMLQNMRKLKIPNFLNPVITSANKALDTIERGVDKKVLATLTEAMKTPEGAKDLLSTLPAAERTELLRVLSNPQTWGVKGKAAMNTIAPTINHLAPNAPRENALAE